MVSLSEMQAQCLAALAAKSSPEGEMCLHFKTIEIATGLSRTHVKRSVRALARKGYAEFFKGLSTEDGDFAGAGYCITNEGQDRAKTLAIETVDDWSDGI